MQPWILSSVTRNVFSESGTSRVACLKGLSIPQLQAGTWTTIHLTTQAVLLTGHLRDLDVASRLHTKKNDQFLCYEFCRRHSYVPVDVSYFYKWIFIWVVNLWIDLHQWRRRCFYIYFWLARLHTQIEWGGLMFFIIFERIIRVLLASILHSFGWLLYLFIWCLSSSSSLSVF